MNKQILKFVEQNWDDFFQEVSEAKPGRLSFVQLSGSHTKDYAKGKNVVLVFPEGQTVPITVAKFMKDSRYDSMLAASYKNVIGVNRSIGVRLLPKMLASSEIDGRVVVFEEYINGVNSADFVRNGIEIEEKEIEDLTAEVFLRLKEVINDLNRARVKVEDKECLKKDFMEILDETSDHLNIDDQLKEKVEESLQVVEKGRCAVYRGVVDFDLVPNNLVFANKRARLIDFDYSADSCLSLFEPVRFLLFYIEMLVVQGYLSVNDVPYYISKLCVDKDWWLRSIAEKYLADLFDFSLLRELFVLSIVHEASLQYFVEKGTRYKKGYLEKFIFALADPEDYSHKLLEERCNDVAYLRRQSVEKDTTIGNLDLELKETRGRCKCSQGENTAGRKSVFSGVRKSMSSIKRRIIRSK